MKKALIVIVALLSLFLLSACAAKPEEESKAKTPTGYPSGQVQRPCVFYNGKLYVALDGGRRERTALNATLTEAAEVKRNDNYLVPSEECVSAQMKEGTKILLLQSEKENSVFYQLDNKYIWQLGVYSYPPETLGPVAK